MNRNQSRTVASIETTERGQSVLDFTIAVSLFLVVLVGVLLFLQAGFAGLADGGGISPDDEVAADRAADYLADEGFGSPDTPNRFNHYCLVAFFDDRTACGFEAGRTPSRELLLGPTRPVNVTVKAHLDDDDTLETLCWNGTAPADIATGTNFWVKPADGGCEVPFSTETSAAANVEYASATRVGTFRTLPVGSDTDRTAVYITVRTW